MAGTTKPIDPESGEDSKHYLTETGGEVVDSTPMAPPIGYNPQPSIFDQVRMMVLSDKLRTAAEEAGMETFEEADDFEVGDDFDPGSPWENDFDPPIKEIVQEVQRLKQKGVPVPEDAEESVEYLASEKEPVRQDPKPKKTKSEKVEEKPEPEQE